MRPPCVGLVSLTSHHLPCRGWGLCSPQRGSRCRAPRWSRPNYRVPSMLALPSKQPPMHGQIYAWKPISVRNTTDVVPPPSHFDAAASTTVVDALAVTKPSGLLQTPSHG
ncbi:Os11g0681950 [Oryza sativa Japonica Group]|uniref:Os11g0681950 protein n=1 Tax=Oryza sativa subsp. japonica TaxID=39947 RepID=A0A0P0Y5M0_ORYSJ|nr:Os11g0681950 [Oryza sativa Japonica Group]